MQPAGTLTVSVLPSTEKGKMKEDPDAIRKALFHQVQRAIDIGKRINS
jgi:hypothetical protein